MQDELNEIKNRYERRKENHIQFKRDWFFSYFVQSEREFNYVRIVRSYFSSLISIKIIEIGAGSGSNLLFFHRLGIPLKNIYANELLEERGEKLKENLPLSEVMIGDACELEYENKFDIVFQSTVFTSILDENFKKKLANKMWSMTKESGIVLWYDFKYDNPNNKDVKGIGKSEIKQLFPQSTNIKFYNVTLAPPIGRRIGRAYNFINSLFPFLRTHLIAVIEK